MNFTYNNENEIPEMPVAFKGMDENHTGAWRNIMPVINYDICVSCMVCWKFCPDTAIEIIDDSPVINYDYCKGCGICATECPKNALEMVKEKK